MKIIVKNKFVSWGGSSKVEDEAGNALYRVKGSAFTFTHRKRLLDLNGNLLYKIRNKWPTVIMHSAYVSDGNGNKLCRVKEKFKIGQPFLVDETSDDIQITGYILHGLQVVCNGVLIGTIKKEVWKLRDYFVLDVPVEQNAAFMIALTIAIDNIGDKNKSSST